MIEADRVDVSEQGAQAVDAPAVAAGGKRVPVIDRIAPALSSRAEIVGRDTGDGARPVLRVEQEQFRVGPDVARVRRDGKWEVADQAHPLPARMGLEAGGLTEQQELSKPSLLDLARQISPRLVDRGRLAADEIFRPLEIPGAAVSGFQRVEQCVIVQPVSLVLTEALK